MNALIGHSGFVGSNLAAQHRFDACFNSKNIEAIRGGSFQLIVCAGVQSKKWWANQHPEADWAGIELLLDALRTVRAESFVLISTIDVYPRPDRVTESSPVSGDNHPYGKHRYAVEQFVRGQFANSYILRLPGLFGRGLKKNVIFDLLNDNCLAQINPAGKYQYYHLAHLWDDIQRCLRQDIHLLNVATEPIRTADILTRFFPHQVERVGPAQSGAVTYDMRSEYARLWNSKAEGYLYDAETVLNEIGQFVAQQRKP